MIRAIQSWKEAAMSLRVKGVIREETWAGA
jgi:hypothetical protein